jgi:hypothetical protein
VVGRLAFALHILRDRRLGLAMLRQNVDAQGRSYREQRKAAKVERVNWESMQDLEALPAGESPVWGKGRVNENDVVTAMTGYMLVAVRGEVRLMG